MRRPSILATAALVAAAALPAGAGLAGTAAAATTTQVHVVNAATDNADSPSGQVSVCIDGTLLAHGVAAGASGGSAAITPGAHTAQIIDGDSTDCASADATLDVTLPSSASSTLMVFKGGVDAPFNASALADLDSCINSGKSRFVVRHAAFTMLIDVLGTLPGATSESTLASFLGGGEQASLESDAGTLSGVRATSAGNPTDTFVTPGDVTLGDGQLVTLYLWGGNNQGAYGSFQTVTPLAACATPTTASTSTTTSSTTSTTVPAAAAQPVAATPTYTG